MATHRYVKCDGIVSNLVRVPSENICMENIIYSCTLREHLEIVQFVFFPCMHSLRYGCPTMVDEFVYFVRMTEQTGVGTQQEVFALSF